MLWTAASPVILTAPFVVLDIGISSEGVSPLVAVLLLALGTAALVVPAPWVKLLGRGVVMFAGAVVALRIFELAPSAVGGFHRYSTIDSLLIAIPALFALTGIVLLALCASLELTDRSRVGLLNVAAVATFAIASVISFVELRGEAETMPSFAAVHSQILTFLPDTPRGPYSIAGLLAIQVVFAIALLAILVTNSGYATLGFGLAWLVGSALLALVALAFGGPTRLVTASTLVWVIGVAFAGAAAVMSRGREPLPPP